MRSLLAMMFIHLLSLSAISAFCFSTKPPTNTRLPFSQQWRGRTCTRSCGVLTQMKQGNSNSDATNVSESGNTSGVNRDRGDVSSDGGSGGGGLVTASDAKSQLFSAFAALDLSDQYDAVLTGLCAKILDNDDQSTSSSSTGSQISKILQDGPMQLLQEMNQKRIVASPRSIMALIDVRKRNVNIWCLPFVVYPSNK
jgi:hypothetical protein